MAKKRTKKTKSKSGKQSKTMKDKKIVIGLTERIKIIGEKTKTVTARIDTGATKSSVDSELAAELKLGPIIGTKMVKSAHGIKMRPMVRVKINRKGKIITRKFTLADRKHMKYRVLIGQNILKHGFLIDPSKK